MRARKFPTPSTLLSGVLSLISVPLRVRITSSVVYIDYLKAAHFLARDRINSSMFVRNKMLTIPLLEQQTYHFDGFDESPAVKDIIE